MPFGIQFINQLMMEKAGIKFLIIHFYQLVVFQSARFKIYML